jgi:putative DNA primase/helicase
MTNATSAAKKRMEWALEYAAAGLQVFPLNFMRDGKCSCGTDCGKNAGKHPIGWLVPHGLKNATTDETTIRSWWARFPDAGVGLVTGSTAGFIVLDIDPRHGGQDSLNGLLTDHGPLPPGPKSKTGGGGAHLFFAHPGGTVGNATGILPGIDLRADGGYIVAPPSGHPSGGTYEWIVPLNSVPLPPPPDWLLDFVNRRREGSTAITPVPSTQLTPDQKIPHGRHHDSIVSTSASLAQRMAGVSFDTLLRAVRAAMSELLDDIDRHENEIADACRSALIKFGRPAPPPPPEDTPPAPDHVVPTDAPPADPALADAIVARIKKEDWFGGEFGITERFLNAHGPTVRYDITRGCWRVLRDGIWPPAEKDDIKGWGQEIIRTMLHEAACCRARCVADRLRDADHQKRYLDHLGGGRDGPGPCCDFYDAAGRLAKWAHAAQGERGVNPALVGARTYRQRGGGNAIVIASELDTDPWALPVRDGVVNLKTGELRPFSPTELWTWKSPYSPDLKSPCPKWMAFLERFAPDPEVRAYLQRVCFYLVTGDTGEQAVFNLWGPGSNGKSTFVETISRLVANAAIRASPNTFAETRNERIPNDIAALHGKRIILVPEMPRGVYLNEDLIHRFSGGDAITARFLHREFFDFYPIGKLFFYGSEKVSIRGQSVATWRRMHFIKATTRFAKPGRKGNIKNYHEILLGEEGDAILAWVLAGREPYLAQGLEQPEQIRADTEEFQQDSDAIGSFLAECVEHPAANRLPVSDMHAALVAWAEANAEKSIAKWSKRRVHTELEERGFVLDKSRKKGRAWMDSDLTPEGLHLIGRVRVDTPGIDRGTLLGPGPEIRPMATENRAVTYDNTISARDGSEGAKNGPGDASGLDASPEASPGKVLVEDQDQNGKKGDARGRFSPIVALSVETSSQTPPLKGGTEGVETINAKLRPLASPGAKNQDSKSDPEPDPKEAPQSVPRDPTEPVQEECLNWTVRPLRGGVARQSVSGAGDGTQEGPAGARRLEPWPAPKDAPWVVPKGMSHAVEMGKEWVDSRHGEGFDLQELERYLVGGGFSSAAAQAACGSLSGSGYMRKLSSGKFVGERDRNG